MDQWHEMDRPGSGVANSIYPPFPPVFPSVFYYFSFTDEEPGEEESPKVQHSGNLLHSPKERSLDLKDMKTRAAAIKYFGDQLFY